MNLEKITQVVTNGIENFKSEIQLSRLLRKGDDLVATVRPDDGEEQGKRLNIRGFHPEDTVIDEAKKAGKGTIVDILVTRREEKIGSVSIRNI